MAPRPVEPRHHGEIAATGVGVAEGGDGSLEIGAGLGGVSVATFGLGESSYNQAAPAMPPARREWRSKAAIACSSICSAFSRRSSAPPIDHGDRVVRHEQRVVRAVALAHGADGRRRDGDDVEIVSGKQGADPLHEPVGVLALEDLEPRRRPGRRDRLEPASARR